MIEKFYFLEESPYFNRKMELEKYWGFSYRIVESEKLIERGMIFIPKNSMSDVQFEYYIASDIVFNEKPIYSISELPKWFIEIFSNADLEQKKRDRVRKLFK